MAYDGLIEFGEVELINLSRTSQLAEALGIDTLWTDPESVAWIQTALAGTDYGLISQAPWYDAGHPASAEFAGIVPISLSGLDDSTLEAITIEYLTDGGSSGRARNKTLSIPSNVAIIASTARGADFGKRWLDRILSASGARTFCSGSDLRYFQYRQDSVDVPPMAHRRDVTLGRGTTVTRKRNTHCSATWMVTFTWTANDPFEYGEPIEQFIGLGQEPTAFLAANVGSGVYDAGVTAFEEQACPVYDVSPIYDPLYPALVPAPTAPNFYPSGWALLPGLLMDRYYVRTPPAEPSALRTVPVVRLTTDVAARYVRVSIWPGDSGPEAFCDPLWTATVSYLPADVEFVIDGEQGVAYAWDGLSAFVRRTDSLLYGVGADPIQWNAFNDPQGLLVTLDVINGDPDFDGGGTVRASLELVPKSV